jgi:hypothetical protein
VDFLHLLCIWLGECVADPNLLFVFVGVIRRIPESPKLQKSNTQQYKINKTTKLHNKYKKQKIQPVFGTRIFPNSNYKKSTPVFV